MELIQQAEDYVFRLFKDKLSPAYTYHNFNHNLRVYNAVKKLIDREKVGQLERTALQLAAWFHDTGYVDGGAGHESRSIHYLHDFAKYHRIEAETLALTETLIAKTELCTEPETAPEMIIRDADCSHFADPDYVALSELLREEWRQTLDKTYTDLEWAKENRRVLAQSHRYFSDYAKRKWQPLKEANVAALQQKIQALEASGVKAKKKDKKEDKPDRGIETMFRTTLNNHTHLSQIADSKANILLSVNAIIISIALSTLIPKLDSPSNAHLIVPTFIMLSFSVISIVFAILSTKPKVTQGSFTRKDIEKRDVNLLFFGNFYKMPVDEYIWAMNEMMKDKQYLYDSMIRDLYYLGLVLNRKYKLLRATYTIFMIGILVSVAAFAIAFHLIRA